MLAVFRIKAMLAQKRVPCGYSNGNVFGVSGDKSFSVNGYATVPSLPSAAPKNANNAAFGRNQCALISTVLRWGRGSQVQKLVVGPDRVRMINLACRPTTRLHGPNYSVCQKAILQYASMMVAMIAYRGERLLSGVARPPLWWHPMIITPKQFSGAGVIYQSFSKVFGADVSHKCIVPYTSTYNKRRK